MLIQIFIMTLGWTELLSELLCAGLCDTISQSASYLYEQFLQVQQIELSRHDPYVKVISPLQLPHSLPILSYMFEWCFIHRWVICCVQHLLDTLCRDVETDLRLHIHMHLQLDSRNPFRVASQQLSTFLRMTPIRLFERDVNARGKLSFFANSGDVLVLWCSWLTTVY